jgi:glutamine synthetase
VGSGVHVHLSLWDADGHPVTLDPTSLDLMPIASRFAAGVLAHAPALIGWTAPSAVSSIRLTPHRWSSAAAFLGRQNREALLRICPVLSLGGADPMRSANLEYRAADAAANPWLVLAALIRAGLDGLDRDLPPPAVLDGDLDELSEAEREALGVRPLPSDLGAALGAIVTDEIARGWFAPDLVATHLSVRRTELEILRDATPAERCRRYVDVL